MVGPMITEALESSIYKENPLAILSWGNSVAIYARITGLIAAVPIPTIKRATIINKREFDMADRTFPKVNTAIPKSSVCRRPTTSPILPRIGAQAAVDMACAKAVHVVLL